MLRVLLMLSLITIY